MAVNAMKANEQKCGNPQKVVTGSAADDPVRFPYYKGLYSGRRRGKNDCKEIKNDPGRAVGAMIIYGQFFSNSGFQAAN